MSKTKEDVKSPEVVNVQLVQKKSEALLWDGSNTVKVLNFAAGWKLIPESTHSDVAGREWTVEKHLEPNEAGQCAFPGDYLVRSSDGNTRAYRPEDFHRIYEEVAK